jgi:hypothetical protein
MKRLAFVALAFAWLWGGPVVAQGIEHGDTIATCGTVAAPYPVGPGAFTVDTSGRLCTNGAGTATSPNISEVCDPTTPTTCANVKAASTPAVATDKSLVVQLNPLSPGIVAPGQTTMSGSAPVTIASDQSPVSVKQTASTTGGATNYFVQPTASDNHVVIKNGAGQVYSIQATNNSATVNYLRLYNLGTGFNGCATSGAGGTASLVGQWAIPASTAGAGIVAQIPVGIAFSVGISICVTSGYSLTDATNATASALSVNVQYN